MQLDPKSWLQAVVNRSENGMVEQQRKIQIWKGKLETSSEKERLEEYAGKGEEPRQRRCQQAHSFFFVIFFVILSSYEQSCLFYATM